jgi:hypothetical protein
MELIITITKSEEKFLKKFITDAMIPYGFEDYFFKTDDAFILKHRGNISAFQENLIFDTRPDGANGLTKFIFTAIGISFMKKYNPEIGNKIKSINSFAIEPKNLKFLLRKNTGSYAGILFSHFNPNSTFPHSYTPSRAFQRNSFLCGDP